jgi:hypothetical protein
MKLAQKAFLYTVLAGALAFVMTMRSGSAKARNFAAPAERNDVTAIDTLLEPGDTMVQHAKAANTRILKSYPKGFELGGEHAPHITMLQRYVKTSELDHLYEAVAKVFAKENPTSWKLKAVKYVYIPDKPLGLNLMVIEPSEDLLRLQKELIDAEAPYEVSTGTTSAFVTTPKDPDILAAVIEYVRVFVPDHSGDHYVPHVTVGLGTMEYLDKMNAEPFDSFTFSPAGASTYHLGNYGTAMRKLHSYKLK